jgi:hypothetical protein
LKPFGIRVRWSHSWCGLVDVKWAKLCVERSVAFLVAHRETSYSSFFGAGVSYADLEESC